MRQRAGAGDFHRDIIVRGQSQQLRQIGPRLRGGRRRVRLLQTEVIDHQLRMRVSRSQLPGLLQPPRAHQVDRQRMPRGGRQHPIEAGVGRVGGRLSPHHDPDGDGALRGRPVGDRLGHPGVVRIDRLDQGEPAGMFGMNGDGVAGIVTVHGKRRHQHCAVDADRVHRGYHLIARDVGWASQDGGPGAAGVIVLIRMHLGIDCCHDFQPSA